MGTEGANVDDRIQEMTADTAVATADTTPELDVPVTAHGNRDPAAAPGTNPTGATGVSIFFDAGNMHDGNATATAAAAMDHGTPLATRVAQGSSSGENVPTVTMSTSPKNDVGASSDSGILEALPVMRDSTVLGQPRSRTSESLPLILCALSIDSLHCIASFLRPEDWSRFGQANKGTNRVCNQVFRRVRMHGFRCATEVIAAWVSP